MTDVSAHLPYEGTIHETLGIKVIEATPQRVVVELDVTPHVHQPTGILHGGASAVIAESAASIGAWLNCDQSRQQAAGVDLNVTHLRPKSEGRVRATATPIRHGRTVSVWNINIEDEQGKMVAVSRCTVAIRDLPQNS
jgi:1,4-dihydroxy-2-naphthoyl-CoA hydrolase